VFSTPVPDITNLKARIRDTFVIRERLYAHPVFLVHTGYQPNILFCEYLG
jgi:hypothetical protein